MSTETILTEVLDEMRRAREKHGENFMGNLTLMHEDTPLQRVLARKLGSVLTFSRMICDGSKPTRISVLVEEVCELSADVHAGRDHRDELVQVAAMALAWLGVDPDVELPSAQRLALLEEDHQLHVAGLPPLADLDEVDADCAACMSVGLDFSPTCNGRPCPHWPVRGSW